jgi:hypothetical protein
VKEFTTAARRAAPSAMEGAEPIQFTVDGQEFTAYPPTPGQLALLISAQAKNREPEESIASIIDFLDGILDENAQAMFRKRILDRDDPFDFDTVEQIMEGLIEEWSARPTSSPSASSSSPANGGRKSTARRHSAPST